MARPPFQIGDFVGQAAALKPVLRRQDGAMARGEPLPHHLFTGASGLGKSLAARVLAERAKTKMVKLRCDAEEGAIVEQLVGLQPSDFAFFDEAHRLRPEVQERLYEVIDHSTVPPGLAAAPAGNQPVRIQPITLVFATDRPGYLLAALFKRIPVTVLFRAYPEREMREIVARIAARRSVLLSPQAMRKLAQVCHGIPRRAEHRVNDVRLYFPDSERRQLRQADIKTYLRGNRIDADGLGDYERAYLDFLSRNKTASLEALAAHLGVDKAFVKYHVEQPLRYRQLITVRSSGRVLTDLGHERVGQLHQRRETNQGD
jgi:Holliday junction DNA helicase RuvB